MSDPDSSQRFLDEHEELKPGAVFCFACHPGVSCFGACCSALDLMLTPFDALRLRRSTHQCSKDFVREYADMTAMPGVGLPLLHLHMQDTASKTCPFFRTEGCAVYENRPAACRTYPLGRATRPLGRATRPEEGGGVTEQIFVLREPHCRGFEQGTEWSPASWMAGQGLTEYNTANDRFMTLVSQLHQLEQDTGQKLTGQQSGMSCLALYQPDDFQRFLVGSHMMDRLDMTEARREDVLHDEEACLDFGYDWLELSLLGRTEHLRPKG